MTNRLNYSYLDHPTLRRMPASQSEWAEYNRVILETAGNVVQGLLDNGQIATQASLPMVQAGNKGSVLVGGVPALTSADVVGSTTITIAAHSIQYDFGQVAYNSGEITGLAYETTYFVYADDPDYEGGAVSYFSLTEPDDLTSDRGRYFVGEIDTPAEFTTGDPPVEGGGGGGAGGGGGSDGYVWP